MNSAASIKGKLRNLAVQEGKPYEYVQTHYLIERLLYRLSISRFSHDFILKGGLLLYAIFEERARATRDIDLLAIRGSNAPDSIKSIFTELSGLSVDDAVTFDPDSIETEHISEGANYRGVRVKIIGFLNRSRNTLRFDIGFGDTVVPRPEEMIYPSLLGMDETRLLVYSKESVVAEKFQAMLYLAQANSRMKDFYDIGILASGFDFDGAVLREAVYQTVTRRGTVLEASPTVFTEEFASLPDKTAQWHAFLTRIRHNEGSFVEILTLIRRFLGPIYQSILHEKEYTAIWRYNLRSWG